MKNKQHALPGLKTNRVTRLGASLVLALSLAVILLLLPITANSIQVTLPHQDQSFNLSLPFGATLARATNGLTLTKTAPYTVNHGAVLTYTLTITNDTNEDLTQGYITDTVPASTTCLQSYRPPAPPYPTWITGCGDPVRWDLIYLPRYIQTPPFTRGTTNVLTFSVTVDEPLPDLYKIVNSDYFVSISAPSAYTHIGEPFTTTVYAPNWAITKTVSGPTVQPGEYLTYTLIISNIGHMDSSGPYVISDTLPAYTDPGTVFSDPAASLVGNDLVWTFSDSLPALTGARTVTYAVQVTNPLTGGVQIVNQNYAVSGGNVYTPTTYGDPVTVTVNSPVTLQISKTATETVQAGDLLTYTLVVSHDATSTGPAYGLVITDAIPADTSLAGADFVAPTAGVTASNGSVVTWTLSSPNPLLVGDVVTMTMTVRVDSPLTSGTVITNQNYGVSVTNTLASMLPGPAVTTTVESMPVLTITKQGLPLNVSAGGQITYTIIYTNTGNDNATGVVIRDIFPISTTNPVDSSLPDVSPGSSIPGGMEWAVPFVGGEGGSGIITLTLDVEQPQPSGTILTNVVSITSSRVVTPAIFTATNEITSTPVLTVSKIGQPYEVSAGGQITYTIVYTNTGNEDAANVVIRDIFPISTTFSTDDSVPSATGSSIPGGRQWAIASVNGNGGSGVITLTLDVDQPQSPGTILTNVVSITSSKVVQPVVFTATNQITSTPVLSISKIGLPYEVSAGGQITYTLRYTNTGNAPATGVVIRDIFPLSTTFSTDDSAPTAAGSSIPGGREWTIVTVNGINGSGVITLTLNVDQPQPPGTILTNVVSITATEALIPAQFTSTNRITSTPILHIHKIAQPSPVAIGAVLTYTLIYSNSGNADATGVTITDTLDSRLIYNGATNGGVHNNGVVTWTGLSVPADAVNYQVQITATVPATLANNTLLTNQFEISDGVVSDSDSITTLVQAPQLSVSKTLAPATSVVRAGDSITYTIMYTNTGPIAASNVYITDTFPVSITNIVSTSTEAVFDYAAPPDYVWFDASIPPGQGGVITITGQVISTPWNSTGGQIVNDVLVVGDAYSDTTTISVEGRPGLPYTITLVAVPVETQVGNTIQLTATVTDIYGNFVDNNNTVLFSTNPALGNFSPTPPIATVNGVAATSQSSQQAGTTTVQALASGASGNITRTQIVTFTPGPLFGFNIDPDPIPDQIAGVTFPITITAVDVFGNPITTFNNTVGITDTTQSMVPTSVTFVNGITVVNVTVYSATSPALDTITVFSGTTTGSADVEILPNIPTTLTVTVDPLSIRICETAQVTATLTDQWLNPIPDSPITLTAFLPSVLLTPATGTTNLNGSFTALVRGSSTGLSPATVRAQSAGFSVFSPDIQVTGPAIPSAITVSVSPPSVPAGNNATITAQVSSCEGPVNNIVVTFTVGSLASIAPPGTATTNSSGVATTTVTAGAIPGVTTITGTVEGPLSDNTPFTITPATSPVLTITKTATPPSGNVYPGGTIVYQIEVSNSGTGDASGIVITDALDANVSGVTGTITSGSGPFGLGTGTITYAVPNLAAGAAVTATLEVMVSTGVSSGTTINNSATASSNETGPIGSSSPVVTHQVITRTIGPVYLPIVFKNYPQPPDLTVSNVEIANTSFNTGDPVVITVTLHNTGTAFSTAFWVDLYLSTSSTLNPAVNQPWDEAFADNVVPYGVAWKVHGMAADSDTVITNLAPNDPLNPNNNYSNFIPNGIGGWPQTWKCMDLNNYFGEPTTYYLYARVDSLDDNYPGSQDPNGEVVEVNENNNLFIFQVPIDVGGDQILPNPFHPPAACTTSLQGLQNQEQTKGRQPVLP